MLPPALYIVPTPIGNLQDITLRAIEVLKQTDIIAAEDTRHSQIFLQSIGVTGKKLISCHNYNEEERAKVFADYLTEGKSIALISDAGTPLISDPGFRVVRELAARSLPVIALPGPCAAVTALSVSGLPTDQFLFYGFLPVKDKELTEELQKVGSQPHTVVFYESPRRVQNTLQKLSELFPDRQCVICRELTKAFESVYRGTCAELYAAMQQDANMQRGEFVLLLAGAPQDAEEGEGKVSDKAKEALSEMLKAGVKVKPACKIVASLTGENKNALYQCALTLKDA